MKNYYLILCCATMLCVSGFNKPYAGVFLMR